MLWDKIEAVMKEQGVTQYELAQRIHVQNSRISILKTGKLKEPRLQFICRIADGLNVPVDAFKLDYVQQERKGEETTRMWKKIEAIMEEKNMTEVDLIGKLSDSEVAKLNRIKYGSTKNPSFSFVSLLATILDVPIDDLRPEDY
ncbi:hypothetical protein IGI39_004754 [Enterococcus sp. AZ135]|uniref:helix-turn-helix domain-containing protein n=1 Tax=unclassified Enterococcus TaxID=2608891 RepID=UPI003F24AD12